MLHFSDFTGIESESFKRRRRGAAEWAQPALHAPLKKLAVILLPSWCGAGWSWPGSCGSCGAARLDSCHSCRSCSHCRLQSLLSNTASRPHLSRGRYFLMSELSELARWPHTAQTTKQPTDRPARSAGLAALTGCCGRGIDFAIMSTARLSA